jgi:hypothetical protein
LEAIFGFRFVVLETIFGFRFTIETADTHWLLLVIEKK